MVLVLGLVGGVSGTVMILSSGKPPDESWAWLGVRLDAIEQYIAQKLEQSINKLVTLDL
jgi:hypothetical protein